MQRRLPTPQTKELRSARFNGERILICAAATRASTCMEGTRLGEARRAAEAEKDARNWSSSDEGKVQNDSALSLPLFRLIFSMN